MATIFEKQTITFYPDETFDGLRATSIIQGKLIDGKSYDVYFDGAKYTCKAEPMAAGNLAGIGIGNKAIVGIGEDSGEPFIFGNDGNLILCVSLDTKETMHEIGIYDTPYGIVLRNYHGENVVYSDIETITFGNTDGGTTTFTRGIALENVPISLDFANGDQTVTAEEETLIKSAVIEKPENLVPENIRINQKVAGIDGSFIGEAEETEVDLNMADGDMVITPSENKLFSSVTVKKPETLTAENIADGINIGGIIGTHKGGGGVTADPFEQYQRVEYITTAEEGTYPYIITNVYADNDIGAEVVASFSAMADRIPMGSRQDSGTTRFYVTYPLSTSSCYYGFNLGSSISCSTKVNTVYRLQTNFMNSRQASIYEQNGTRKAFANFTQTLSKHTVPIAIFGYNSAASGAVISKREYKLYSARITKGFDVIREYIPCCRKSDGEIGLYEKFTGAFLTNEGEGSFAKGPNV